MANGKGIEIISLPAGIAHIPQGFGNCTHSVSLVAVKIKDNANQLGFFLIDRHNTVFLVITVKLVVSQHPTIFDGLTEAEFDSL